MQQGIPYWHLSGFYFFYFATLGVFLPFWGLYLEASGFDAIAIGELSAMLVATKIIAPNVWGQIADHFGKSMVIIRWGALLAVCIFSGFLCQSGYFWFALLTIGFSFFWNATLPQFEAVTLLHLQEDTYRYSQIRVWGSIGFIIAVLVIGKIIDVYGISFLPNVILFLLISIWLLALLTPEITVKTDASNSINIWKILRKSEVLTFFVVCVLLHAAHGAYYVFFSIYLDEYGYSKTLICLLWALGVGAEVILFIYMRGLLCHLKIRHLLLISLMLGVIRWLLIAKCASQLWLLLLAQLLHAATFGVSHIAAVYFIRQYFGDQHQGKGQGLYSSLGFGLGGMIGSFCSGYFWLAQGAEFIYILAAIFSALAWLIVFFGIGRKNIYKKYC